MTTPFFSQVYQNYCKDVEVAINHQINLELYASYIYLSMSYDFDCDDGGGWSGVTSLITKAVHECLGYLCLFC
uniref:Ferritin n=1 Tax=Sus scrofa TaxID=9823 RepID=A0A8D0PKX5_PIG